MFIQVETTPNPQSLKFIPGREVTAGEPVNIPNREQAHKSPLAVELFKFDEVESVFLGYDFITVTKKENSSWDILKTNVLTTVMDFYTSGRTVISDSANEKPNYDANDEGEITKQIREIIETRVRPAVAQDGGDIVFVDYKEGIVTVELQGSCSGCPSSTVTLKNGIENMLKYYVPEVIAVESV